MAWIPHRWRRRPDAPADDLCAALRTHWPGIALVVEAHGIVCDAAPEAEARGGVPVGRRLHELDEDPLHGELVRALARCVAGADGWRGRVRCRLGAGRRRYQDVCIRPLGPAVEGPEGDGQPRWLVTLFDVDDQVVPARAEHDRLLALERMLGRLPGAVFRLRQTAGGEWRFDYLSDGVEALCGLSARALRERPARWFERVAEADREALTGELARSSVGLTPWSQTFRLALPEGERWVEARAGVRREGDGDTVWEGWWQDVSRRMAEEARVQALVSTDMLTGALNRRGFRANGRAVLAHAARHGRPLALAMLDLDHFKALNDTHGHAAGDIALQTFVRTCRDSLRPYDLLGRLGGEEFAVLLPDGEPDEARAIFERLRESVAETELWLGEACVHVTVSLGLALIAPGGDLDEALARADRALYRAKQAGRNRVEGP